MVTDWGRERWRKLYLREPVDQELMAWQARGLRDLLIRLADDDGRVARDVAALTLRLRAGHELAPHVDALIEDGFLVAQEGGLYVRNLPRAQRSAAARGQQDGAPTPPRATGGGRWANTTPEQRAEAARKAASGRWGPRPGDASGDASPDASTHMRHDASTHQGDASGDAFSPRAVSGSLDPSQSVEEEEKREEERESARAGYASGNASGDASTHDASTHRRDPLRASFGSPHPDDLWAFEQWQKTFGKTGSEFSGRRCVALLERRRAGMTWRDVLDALAGAKADGWVNGTKDGTRHDGIAAIFGDADRYEGFRDAGRALLEKHSGIIPVRPRREIETGPRPVELGEVPADVLAKIGPRRAAPNGLVKSPADQVAALERAERERVAGEQAEPATGANG